MRRAVISWFKSLEQAQGAIKEIGEAKLANNEISLVVKADHPTRFWFEMGEELTEQAANPLAVFNGMLVQTQTIELPELGKVAAAGPLGGTLMREGDEGLSQSLANYGLSEDRAKYYEQKVRDNMVLALIETDNSKVNRVANILSAFGGKDVEKWSRTIDKPLKPRK